MLVLQQIDSTDEAYMVFQGLEMLVEEEHLGMEYVCTNKVLGAHVLFEMRISSLLFLVEVVSMAHRFVA